MGNFINSTLLPFIKEQPMSISNVTDKAFCHGVINSFISNECCWLIENPEIVIFSCDFDKKHFLKELFKELSIYFPCELAQAVKKRQAEFLAGRYAAKQAMAQLKMPSHPLPIISIGKDRCPIWPNGLVGSITHNNTQALCALLVEPHSAGAFIGIDIESYISAEESIGFVELVHTEAELAIILAQGIPVYMATTLIFSAKESLFKALYPQVAKYFDFNCAVVTSCSLEHQQLTFALTKYFPDQNYIKKMIRCSFRLNPQSVVTLITGKW